MSKNKLIIALLLILVIIAGIFWMKSRESKTPVKKAKKEIKPENSFGPNSIKPIPSEQRTFTYTLEPESLKEVSFKIPGKLENFTWKKGDNFKTGELLFMLNNEDFFEEVSALKIQLKAILETKLRNISDEKLYASWQNFYSEIKETDLFPKPPTLNYNNQQIGSPVFDLILQIQEMESEVSNYFYLAPFDGEFKDFHLKAGKNVRKNQAIASIYPVKYAVITYKVHQKDLDYFKANVIDNDNRKYQFKTISGSDSVLVTSKVKYNTLKPMKFFSKNTVLTTKIYS